MSTRLEPGKLVELYLRPWVTFKPVLLHRQEHHNYLWDETDPRHKSRNVTLVTSEKISPLRRWWLAPCRALVRFKLNGHEIETHEYKRDGNFAFDLCPTPTPGHEGDVIGEHYNPGGYNVFTIENLGPSAIRVLTLFIYQAHHRK